MTATPSAEVVWVTTATASDLVNKSVNFDSSFLLGLFAIIITAGLIGLLLKSYVKKR